MYQVLSNDKVTKTDMDNTDIYNEKLRFKRLLEMIDRINTIPFQSEQGKALQVDIKVCYTEIIRPIIVNKMNELVKLEK